MPHMNGATLIRQMRALAPTLPILMVSAQPGVKLEALAAGANWFLTKKQIMEHLPPLLRQHAAGATGPTGSWQAGERLTPLQRWPG